MLKLNRSKIFLYLWILGIITVTFFSLTPIKHGPDLGFLVYDKVLHFSCYAVLSLAACQIGSNWNQKILYCSLTFLISVVIEFLQPLTGRSFEGLDMVANLIGVSIGILLTKIFR